MAATKSAKNSGHYRLSQLTKDATLQYYKAIHLCIVTSGALLFAIIMNYFEDHRVLLIALSSIFILTLLLFCILLHTRQSTIPLVCISVLLMGLGVFLLCGQGLPDGSSLFWFLLLPPMLMFCVGLRLGTVFFFCFYVFLLLVLLTPLESLLIYSFPHPFRWRFLGAILCMFIFSWMAEYTRTQTRKALIKTVGMLEHSSLTDPLTGLGNRRDFQNYFTINQAQMKRWNRTFSIALVDIDFFKKINDTFGHAVGDLVLCHVASRLVGHLRASDRTFRWGGEEFIILMPDTTAAEAHVIMERLRHDLEVTPCVTDDGHSISLTVSMGLHSGILDGTIEEHISIADEKLYLAKRSGRNQVQS